MSSETSFPSAEEIEEVKSKIQELRVDAQDWYDRADAIDQDFVGDALDDGRRISPDDVPNGEERARLKSECFPTLQDASRDLARLEADLARSSRDRKFTPEQAASLLEDIQDDADEAAAILDDIGDVKK